MQRFDTFHLLFIMSHKFFAHFGTIVEVFKHAYYFKDMDDIRRQTLFIVRKCLDTVVINYRI